MTVSTRAPSRGAARWRVLPWFAGCAALPKFEAPKLSVVSTEDAGRRLLSQRLQVRMRVLNPNARELPIKGITYRIEVNDAELGNGSHRRAVHGAGDGRGGVRHAGHGESGRRARQSCCRGAIRRSSSTTGWSASVSLSSGFLRRIPFDERGSVKLK